ADQQLPVLLQVVSRPVLQVFTWARAVLRQLPLSLPFNVLQASSAAVQALSWSLQSLWQFVFAAMAGPAARPAARVIAATRPEVQEFVICPPSVPCRTRSESKPRATDRASTIGTLAARARGIAPRARQSAPGQLVGGATAGQPSLPSPTTSSSASSSSPPM